MPRESLVVSRVRSCHATIRGMKKQQLYTRLGPDVVERVIRRFNVLETRPDPTNPVVPRILAEYRF